MRESILIVDDEAGVRSSLAGILADEGYAADAVDSGEAALKAVEARRYDLLLLDVWMPGMDGLETLARIRTLDAHLPVVVISGHGSIETAVKAVRMGAQDFVEKPLSLEKTLLAVKNALRQRRLEDENRVLKEKVEHRFRMVGESPALRCAARGRGARGAVERARDDLRRERHRQGAGRPQHPRPQPARRRAVRGGQLRGHPGGADRERAVRPHAGRLHRAPSRPRRGSSSWRTAAPSSSTRSGT